MMNENKVKLEPGEVAMSIPPEELKIETEDISEVHDKHQKEQLNNEENTEIEFLVCFRDILIEMVESIKSLISSTLEQDEIIDFFLIKYEKKHCGFLRVASQAAMEKILKYNKWSVNDRVLRIKKSNPTRLLIKNHSLPASTSAQNYHRNKRKLDDGEVKESAFKKMRSDDNNFQNSIETKTDNEGQRCRRFCAYLGNLHYRTTDEDITRFLTLVVDPEQIIDLRRPIKFPPIAFVDLANKESFDKVLTLNGFNLMGRIIKVSVDRGKKN